MLIILFLLPIPLGANRAWAWGFFEICIFILTFFVIIKYRKTKSLGIQSYFSILYLWIGFIILASLQVIPLPEGLVSFLSPTSHQHYVNVNSIQFYISIDSAQSMISFIKLLSFFCLFVCVMALINNEQRLTALIATIMLVGTWQALYGILEVILGLHNSIVFNLPTSSSATGSFVYSHHFANFITLGLAAALGLLVSIIEKSKSEFNKSVLNSSVFPSINSRIIISICIVIMVLGLIMSHSKIGIISFFAAIAAVGALVILIVKKRSKGLQMLIIGFFVINVIVISVFFGIDKVKDRLIDIPQSNESIDEVIRDAYPIIADFPVFGSGSGSFYSTFPSYQIQEVNNFYDHLHNDYLQFVIEYGLLGAFILWTLMIFTLYKTLRAMRKRKHAIFKGSAIACLIAFVGTGIHMSSDFPLQAYANACYFVVFMALAMVINSLKFKSKK